MYSIPEQWTDEENNKNILVSFLRDNGIVLVVYKTVIDENNEAYSLDFYDNLKKYF
jgi:hypothetical protein